MHFNRFLLALPLAAGSFANSFHVRDDEKPVQDIKINKQFIIQVEPVCICLYKSEMLPNTITREPTWKDSRKNCPQIIRLRS
jgi:hypothetical protein